MAVITTGIVGNEGAGNVNRSLMVKASQHRYRHLVNKEMIPFSELRNRIASDLLQGAKVKPNTCPLMLLLTFQSEGSGGTNMK